MPAPPTAHAVLTVAQAVKALPMRDADARQWLHDEGLVVSLGGRPRVLWGRVLEALAPAPAVPRRPVARAVSCGAGEGPDDMAKPWPKRPLVVGSAIGRPMKARGRRDDGRYYWRVRVSTGGGQVTLKIAPYTPTRSGWATWSEAEAAIIQSLAQQAARPTGPRIVCDDEITVAECVERYLESRIDLRPRSLRVYRMAADRIAELLAGTRVVDVTPQVLRAYVAARLSGKRRLSNQVINNDWSVLRPAIAWAIDTGLVSLTAVPKFPRAEYTPQRKSRGPEIGVLRRSFAWLEQHDVAVYRALKLQMLVGARIGEVWNLRWRDVEGGQIALDGKTGRRVLPISDDLARLLEELREVYPVGPDQKVAGPLAEASDDAFRGRVNHRLRKLPWSEIGKRWTSNDLRALFCQALIESGVDLSAYCAMTGHSPRTAQGHYWRAKNGTMAQALRKLAMGQYAEVAVVAMREER